jgi:hypothetical protein
MPHKAYYIEGEIFQEFKSGVNSQDTPFTLPAPQRTLTEGAHYWPLEMIK